MCIMKNILIIDSPNTPYIDDLALESEILKNHYNIILKNGIPTIKDHEFSKADCIIVFYGNVLKEQDIKQMQNCQGIVVATTGYNNVDITAASQLRIPVCNLINPVYEEVADHTILLLLACVRKMKHIIKSVESNKWNWQEAYGTKRLKGSTLGLIGYGNIGKAVAIRALNFGLNVIAYDPFCHDMNVVKISSLEDLLSKSDIISLHCPLNSSTHHILNRKTLNMCPNGVIIINTARGGLIDQQVALEFVKKEKISALGLDVLEDETLIPQELAADPRIILTPHMAFYSTHSHKAFRSNAALAAVNFCEGKGYLNNIINNTTKA